MTKCEFCDTCFKSDLDVSKHLISETHRNNVIKAVQLQPMNRANLKDHHTNIVKVFESLKLRTPKDVRDLADKNYFAIPDNRPDILDIADELVHVFLKCIAEQKTRTMSPKTRKLIIESFELRKPDIDDVAPRPQVAPLHLGEPNQRRRPAPEPPVEAAAPQPSTSRSEEQARQPNPGPPAPKRKPTVPAAAFRAQPAVSAPVSIPGQARTLVPNQLPNPGPRQPQGPRQAPVPAPRQAVPPRPLRPQAPTPPQIRPTPTPAPRLNLRPQMPRPPLQPQPQPPVAPAQPLVAQARAPEPNPLQVSPPKTGPQPRLDSTYRPQLAKIKIEPQDK